MSSTSTLTLTWTMTDDELEKQYKILCKELHPDRNTGRNTTAQFQELKSLYDRIKGYRSTSCSIDLVVSLTEIFHGCIKDVVVADPRAEEQLMILPVYIPMGTSNGTIMVLDTVCGGKVKVKICEVNDTKFIRDGFNLIAHLDITLPQALIGDPVVMTHFNRIIDIPTQIPHSNYRHIIHGMGMPIPNEVGTVSAGDLYIVYNIVMPRSISKELAQELLDSM